MKVTGANEVRRELRHTGERVVNNARRAMNRAAQRILTEAKINAPRDKWNLEEAIYLERTTGDHGRLQLSIDIMPSVNGVDVQQYAVIVHEHYESIIGSDDPNAREGTRQKQDEYPDHYIGGKFLERAAQKEEKSLTRYLISDITKAIEGK